jgi:hypothetical protein
LRRQRPRRCDDKRGDDGSEFHEVLCRRGLWGA